MKNQRRVKQNTCILIFAIGISLSIVSHLVGEINNPLLIKQAHENKVTVYITSAS